MATSEIRFGPFFLGCEPARLKRGEDVVKLRPKSLDVLCYLAQRPGQLVSKKELLTQVWTGRVISDTGLRMCIGEIRAALRDDADAPHYLETVVGQGYRFLEYSYRKIEHNIFERLGNYSSQGYHSFKMRFRS